MKYIFHFVVTIPAFVVKWLVVVTIPAFVVKWLVVVTIPAFVVKWLVVVTMPAFVVKWLVVVTIPAFVVKWLVVVTIPAFVVKWLVVGVDSFSLQCSSVDFLFLYIENVPFGMWYSSLQLQPAIREFFMKPRGVLVVLPWRIRAASFRAKSACGSL